MGAPDSISQLKLKGSMSVDSQPFDMVEKNIPDGPAGAKVEETNPSISRMEIGEKHLMTIRSGSRSIERNTGLTSRA